MPYTKQEARKPINPHLEEAVKHIHTAGDLTYAITYLMHLEAIKLKKTYGRIAYNDLHSVRGCCIDASDEFYRIVMGRHEDKVRIENGPVSELDALTLEEVR